MASRNTTRIASTAEPPKPSRRHIKGNTLAQSQYPASQVQTRATRSRSQDPNENDVVPTRSSRKRGMREEVSDSEEGRRVRKGKGRQERATEELPIVEEESLQTSKIEESRGEPSEQTSGDVASEAGENLLDSQAAEDMDMLDASEMVEQLPELYKFSARILEILTPSNREITPEFVEAILQESRDQNSKLSRKLRSVALPLQGIKSNFSTRDYISPLLVLQKLFNTINPKVGNFRPEPVLLLANIASFQLDLLHVFDDQAEMTNRFRKLDEVFPFFFLTTYEKQPEYGSSALLEKTFDLALAIRSHTLLAVLRQESQKTNFDPEHWIKTFFFDIPQSTDAMSLDQAIEGEAWKSLAGMSTTPAAKAFQARRADQLKERVQAFQSCIQARAKGRRARQHFDFDRVYQLTIPIDFLTTAALWCNERRKELIRNILEQRGIEHIAKSLKVAVENPEGLEDLVSTPKVNRRRSEGDSLRASLVSRLQPSPSIVPSSTGKSFYTGARAAQFLARPTRAASPLLGEHGPETDLQTPGTMAQEVQDPTSMDGVDQRSKTAAAPTSSFSAHNRSTQQLLDVMAVQSSLDNKENRPVEVTEPTRPKHARFLDRQSGATRVTFAEENGSTAPGAVPSQTHMSQENARHPPSSSKVKTEFNPAPDLEESEDEGFQVADLEKEPRRAPIPSTSRTTKRVSPGEDVETPPVQRRRIEPASRSEVETRSQHDQLQQNAWEQTGEESEEASDFNWETYKQVLDTKPERKFAAYGDSRARVQWSYEETETLLNLINKLGTKWTEVLRAGQRTGGLHLKRDSVSLKDKARNIKVDLLMCGAPLPKNFDLVTLGQKERARILKAGYNPYRLEGELPGQETLDPGTGQPLYELEDEDIFKL